jgi:hypothetical protein
VLVGTELGVGSVEGVALDALVGVLLGVARVVGPAVGPGVALESSMTIVLRGAGSSAEAETRLPATNAPRGSVRARAAKAFQKVRMAPTIVPHRGSRVRAR